MGWKHSVVVCNRNLYLLYFDQLRGDIDLVFDLSILEYIDFARPGCPRHLDLLLFRHQATSRRLPKLDGIPGASTSILDVIIVGTRPGHCWCSVLECLSLSSSSSRPLAQEIQPRNTLALDMYTCAKKLKET